MLKELLFIVLFLRSLVISWKIVLFLISLVISWKENIDIFILSIYMKL